jgi:hypothetical protein
VADLVVLVEIFVSFCRFVDYEKDSFDVVLASDKRFNSRGWSQRWRRRSQMHTKPTWNADCVVRSITLIIDFWSMIVRISSPLSCWKITAASRAQTESNNGVNFDSGTILPSCKCHNGTSTDTSNAFIRICQRFLTLEYWNVCVCEC